MAKGSPRVRKFCVSKEEEGIRLQNFLYHRLEQQWSMKQLKTAVDRNRCRMNGRLERFGRTRLSCGDQIEMVLLEEKPTTFTPLFEDHHLLAINKPAGTLSVGAQGVQGHFQELLAVHRLDRDTSGVLLFAKTAQMQEHLASLFRTRAIKKSYLALVEGIPKQKQGVIHSRLRSQSSKRGSAFQRSVESGPGEEAVTQWEVLKTADQVCLLRCFPKTGRTHQIRAHLFELGYPIIGDGQYGHRRQRTSYFAPRQLLHAHSLEWRDLEGRLMRVVAPLPEDFFAALRYFKLEGSF